MILAYLQWNPDPEIINIFGFSLRYYGVLFVTGLMISTYVLGLIFKKENLPADSVERLSLYGVLGIIIGARLGHCLFYEPDYYLSHPLEIFLPVAFPADGGIEFTGYLGLASHGGVLGLIIGLYLYSRKSGQSFVRTLDLIAVVAGISFGFIRLGNFMNSEIIGMPTSKPWAIIFEQIDTLPRHPAQLYEAIAYFSVAVLLLILYTKRRDRFNPGFLFGLATVLFFTARIMIEFVKENQVGFEDGMLLNMGQLLSLPYIVVGIGFIIYGLSKRKSSITTSE